MRQMFAFLAVTVDGYHEGPQHELDWHNAPDAAESGFPVVSGFPNLDRQEDDEVDTLLFGRVTYEQMAAFWPTPEAKAAEPRVAVRMNNLAKYVVSRTLDSVAWATTRLINDDVVGQLTRLKQQPGKSIAILGSSTLTASLLQDGLIDELRILVNPIILGQGYRVFQSGGRADRYEAYHGHVVPIRERAVALRAGLPSRLLTCRAMERPGASCTTLITGSVS